MFTIYCVAKHSDR